MYTAVPKTIYIHIQDTYLLENKYHNRRQLCVVLFDMQIQVSFLFTDPNWPKLASHGSRLPSFTEVNFSDLTSVGSSASLAGGSPSKESPVKKSANSTAADVKEELENILRQLDQMFPFTGSESK